MTRLIAPQTMPKIAVVRMVLRAQTTRSAWFSVESKTGSCVIRENPKHVICRWEQRAGDRGQRTEVRESSAGCRDRRGQRPVLPEIAFGFDDAVSYWMNLMVIG